MRKTTVVYDDSRIPDKRIRSITGGKSFGETVYKRICLRERTRRIVLSAPSCDAFLCDPDPVIESSHAVIRLYSDMAIVNADAFAILAEKALYAKECFQVKQDSAVAAVIYPDAESFQASSPLQEESYPEIRSDAFCRLSDADAFRRFITGGFDARYFNELTGDDHVVVKHSQNTEKLKKEYTFYSLLPEEMKHWFVQPFSYREENGGASYSMQRYHMTDLAIRYVHGAISPAEFENILSQLFRFLEERKRRDVSEETFRSVRDALYVGKVEQRFEALRKHADFAQLDAMVAQGTDYDGIGGVIEEYLTLYEKMTGPVKKPQLAVGHGDLCFSNILYSEEVDLMLFIDPKGALTEEELYLDPCYDLAKLSHSILGGYDFFNSDLFEISPDEDLKLKLRLDLDGAEYRHLFENCLTSHGYDVKMIRLYEASLFLSMLPLHMDRKKKVLGFVLNAISILKECKNG